MSFCKTVNASETHRCNRSSHIRDWGPEPHWVAVVELLLVASVSKIVVGAGYPYFKVSECRRMRLEVVHNPSACARHALYCSPKGEALPASLLDHPRPRPPLVWHSRVCTGLQHVCSSRRSSS